MQSGKINKKRVKINVLGVDYTILTENDERYVLDIANKIDKQANIMLNSNPNITNIMSMILIAMEYGDELNKEKQTSENLRIKINEYISETSKLKLELNKAQNRIEKLNQSLKKTTEENRIFENKILKKNNNNTKKSITHNTITSNNSEVETEFNKDEYLQFFNKDLD
ncbi:MAG: cell division protein ZapA [Clostridia bacterium]|nr:cell division protein ZapA [Clostridia bacterium]